MSVPSPTVVRPEEGSHPRPSEKISCSTRPNQNTGSASPANDSADETRSGQRQRVSAGGDAQGRGGDHREKQRRRDQFQRGRYAFPDADQDRASVAVAVAPVADEESGEPLDVLAPQRLVEAQRATQALEVLGAHVGVREVHRQRTARHQVQQPEHAGRDHQQQWQRAGDPPDQRNSHSCTFQKTPVLVGLPLKPCSVAGTASSLVMA